MILSGPLAAYGVPLLCQFRSKVHTRAVEEKLEDDGVSGSCYSPGIQIQNFLTARGSVKTIIFTDKTRVSPKDVAKDAVEKCCRENFLPSMVLKITLEHFE